MGTLGRIVGGVIGLVLLGVLVGSEHLGRSAPFATTIVASEPDALNQRIIQSGHSLTDPLPEILRALVIAAGAGPEVVIDRSTSPGSTIEYRWRHGPDEGMKDARHDIGQYEMLILTERVPLLYPMRRHNSAGEALKWLRHAHQFGNDGRGARTMLYATWVSLASGSSYDDIYSDPEGHIAWRERLPLEFARWFEIAETVNRHLPSGAEPMEIIPATLVLAAAYDATMVGNATVLGTIDQLFSDDIHLSEAGAYLVALTQLVSIYDIDPRGLPVISGDESVISTEMAAWMQELAWSVVQNYKAGLTRYRANYADFTAQDFQDCLWQDLAGRFEACADRSS